MIQIILIYNTTFFDHRRYPRGTYKTVSGRPAVCPDVFLELPLKCPQKRGKRAKNRVSLNLF